MKTLLNWMLGVVVLLAAACTPGGPPTDLPVNIPFVAVYDIGVIDPVREFLLSDGTRCVTYRDSIYCTPSVTVNTGTLSVRE